jgi:predicted PurR-regulated permease PerM
MRRSVTLGRAGVGSTEMPRKSHVSRIVRAPSVAALLALATVVVLVSSFGGLAVPALALALLAIVVGVLAGRGAEGTRPRATAMTAVVVAGLAALLAGIVVFAALLVSRGYDVYERRPASATVPMIDTE